MFRQPNIHRPGCPTRVWRASLAASFVSAAAVVSLALPAAAGADSYFPSTCIRILGLAAIGNCAPSPDPTASGGLPAPPAAAPDPCPKQELAVPASSELTTFRRATLCLLNRVRAAHHLAPLTANTVLTALAQRYASLMVSRRFFAHISPGGSTLVSRVRGTSYLGRSRTWQLGENLAWGTLVRASPAGTVADWMLSPEHRHNILRPGFRDIGIGIATGAPTDIGVLGSTYTADFGAR